MKRMFITVLTVLLAVTALAGCANKQNTQHLWNTLEAERNPGDLVAVDLSYDAFCRFLLDPSMDIIFEDCSSYSIYRSPTRDFNIDEQGTYYREFTKDEYLEEVFVSSEGLNYYYVPEGLARPGLHDSFIIYKSTVSFIGSTQEVQSFLAQQGIDCTVTDTMVITSAGEDSKIVWVRSDKGSYFLTINEYFYEDVGDEYYPDESPIVYRAYTAQALAEKRGAKEYLMRPVKTAILCIAIFLVLVSTIVIVCVVHTRRTRKKRREAYRKRFEGTNENR